MKALVAFTDIGTHWAVRFLKRGFRHVIVAVAVGDYWILADPRIGTLRLEVVAGTDFDLTSHYRQHGYTVVETEVVETEPRCPWMNNNCVGLAKAVLGLRAPLVWTPHQLYRRLERNSR